MDIYQSILAPPHHKKFCDQEQRISERPESSIRAEQAACQPELPCSRSRLPPGFQTLPLHKREASHLSPSIMSRSQAVTYCSKLSPLEFDQLGFLLGGDWDEMKELKVAGDRMSILDQLLQQITGDWLSAERLAQALYLLSENIQAQKVCDDFNLPPCEQLFTPPSNHDAPMTAMHALLAIRAAGKTCGTIPPAFGIEMGLSPKGHKQSSTKMNGENSADQKYKLCRQLQAEGLLTYDRLATALAYFEEMTSTSKKDFARKSDYRVTHNRIEALKQTLSLRDLVHFIPKDLDISQVEILGAEFTDTRGTSMGRQERIIFALAGLYEHSDGHLTANDFCRFLCHPLVKMDNQAEHILETLTGTQSHKKEQLTCLDLLPLSKTYVNPELLGQHLNIPEADLLEILRENQGETANNAMCKNVYRLAQRFKLLTPGNFMHALEQMNLRHLSESCKRLNGVEARPIPRPSQSSQPYLTDDELGLNPEPMDVDIAPQSVPLTIEHCRLCNPASNWFRTALAMGLSFDEVRLIERLDPESKANTLDAMWHKLLSKYSGYETGHLTGALTFIGDESSLKTLPAWMNCPPQRALADISGEATRSYCLLFVSECLAPKAQEFGKQLGIDENEITLLCKDSNDPSRIILNMIDSYITRTQLNNQTFMTTLTKAIETLTGHQNEEMHRVIEKTLKQLAPPIRLRQLL